MVGVLRCEERGSRLIRLFAQGHGHVLGHVLVVT
jgi:hypothetical protein